MHALTTETSSEFIIWTQEKISFSTNCYIYLYFEWSDYFTNCNESSSIPETIEILINKPLVFIYYPLLIWYFSIS